MKKLMTLLGVMAFALGAFADNISGVNFDNVTSLGKLSSNTGDNPTMTAGTTGSTTFWYSAAGKDLDATVTSYASQPDKRTVASEQGNNVNYLKVESAPYTAPLYRSILANAQTGSFSPTNINSGLYIDTLVQFTVGSDSADQLDSAAKLALWVGTSEDTENAPTNIFVRAGYISESGLVATNYVCNVPENFSPENWYRVTVKAINNIVSEGTYVGFVVFVDGVALAPGANAISDDPLTLAPAVSKFSGKIFPSMINSGDFKQTLSAVGFSGTGAVDDLAFTATAPFDGAMDQVAFRLDWDTHVATLGVTIGGVPQEVDVEDLSKVFLYNVSDTVSISITYENGYTSTYGNAVEFTEDVPDVITITSYAPGAAYWNGNAWVNVADIDAALVAVGENGGTIKLLATETQTAASGITVDPGLGNAVVLDLAGKTLRGQEDSPVIVVESGTLVITNSTVEVGKILADDRDFGKDNDDGSIIIGENASLKVYGGLIDGIIYGEYMGDDGVFQIFGGTFYDYEMDSADDGFVYADYMPAEGYTATPAEDEGVWYVTVAEAAPEPFVIRIVKTEGEPVEYDTLPEAIAAYEAGDVIEFGEDFVDLTGTTAVFNKAGTFVFAFNSAYMQTYAYLGPASGYNMTSIPPTFENLFYTYTVTEQTGVAKLIHSDDSYQWFDSFESAYSNATAGDSLLVKIDGNFNPNISSLGDKAFNTVTFETESTDPIQIATYAQGGGFRAYMTANNWVAPATATLTLSTDQTVARVAAGTLNVPSGVRLTTTDGAAFNGVSSLTGTGRIVVNGSTTLTTPSGSLQLLCQNTNWNGTLEIMGVNISAACNLKLFGNANSTVCFNNAGCALTANNENAHAIGTLEIGPYGFELIGNYSAGVFTLPCAVTGTGAFKVSALNSDYGTDRKDVKFTGDVSGFTGNITFDDNANARVVFGTGAYPSGAAAKCIIVTSGTEMTLPSAATWNAPSGIIVNGGLDVQGTLTVPASNLYGTGVVKFHNAAKAVRAANSWAGTYRIDWAVPTGAFVIGDYGRNAEGTIEIMQDINGAYPATAASGGTSPSIVPTVKLSANWTINDGWGTTTTFAKLTGTGNLTVNGKTSTGDTDVPYTITRLEGYTGTLGGVRGKLKIGTIVASEEPLPNTKLVKLASATVRAFTDLDQTVVMYNNAVVEGITLEKRDDGIYVAVPPASDTYEVDGETAIGDDGSFDVPAGTTTIKIGGYDVTDGFTIDGTTATLNAPEIVEEEEKEAVEIGDDEVTLNVDLVPGLYYGVGVASSLDGGVSRPDTLTQFDGTNEGDILTVTKPEGDKGFFKVFVDIKQ